MCTYPIVTNGDDQAQAVVEGRQKPRPRIPTPEQQLVRHFSETFGFAPDPDELRRWLTENWWTVSKLAHAVHDASIARGQALGRKPRLVGVDHGRR